MRHSALPPLYFVKIDELHILEIYFVNLFSIIVQFPLFVNVIFAFSIDFIAKFVYTLIAEILLHNTLSKKES